MNLFAHPPETEKRERKKRTGGRQDDGERPKKGRGGRRRVGLSTQGRVDDRRNRLRRGKGEGWSVVRGLKRVFSVTIFQFGTPRREKEGEILSSHITKKALGQLVLFVSAGKKRG